MQVKEIMTSDVACCSRDTKLPEVARQMVEHDCGAISVVDDEKNRQPIGMVTDRDIVCRTVAEGKDPGQLMAGDCMSEPCVTVTPETSIEDCCQVLEENQVRRVPVVDAEGGCCGIVAQADIAQRAPERETAHVVRDVSKPTREASAVGAGTAG